jgi:hypothetical protein
VSFSMRRNGLILRIAARHSRDRPLYLSAKQFSDTERSFEHEVGEPAGAGRIADPRTSGTEVPLVERPVPAACLPSNLLPRTGLAPGQGNLR